MRNFAQLKKDLLLLDRQMKQLSARNKGLPFVASHPVYQYLARRYDLKLKMVMWEGEPVADTKQRLLDMGIQGLIFSPCFNKPDQGDFLSVMKENLGNLEMVFASP